jgi:hypothetical protein
MEPRKSEEPLQARGEGQASPSPQPARKRRFQIVKLEERIAPRPGPLNKSNNHLHCGSGGRTC